MSDLVLPAFELDCREWLVVTPEEAGIEPEADGAPMLAVLSTLVINDVDSDLYEATGSLTVGLLDSADDLDVRPVAPGSIAHELLDDGAEPGTRRYVMPAPDDNSLALVAEFVVPATAGPLLERRVEALMTSFRWQAA